MVLKKKNARDQARVSTDRPGEDESPDWHLRPAPVRAVLVAAAISAAYVVVHLVAERAGFLRPLHQLLGQSGKYAIEYFATGLILGLLLVTRSLGVCTPLRPRSSVLVWPALPVVLDLTHLAFNHQGHFSSPHTIGGWAIHMASTFGVSLVGFVFGLGLYGIVWMVATEPFRWRHQSS